MENLNPNNLCRAEVAEKWQKVLDFPNYPEIKGRHRREVTAVLLENQFQDMQKPAHKEATSFLREATGHANSGGGSIAQGNLGDNTGAVAGYDPILISLVRRAMPQLIAYDIAGVQPMTQPTGLIFAFKSRYTSQDGTEALFNEPDTGFSADGGHAPDTINRGGGGTNPHSPGVSNVDPNAAGYATGRGIKTALGEQRGFPGQPSFPEMAFSIEKTSVVADTRALKAEYTHELAQDLKSVHGLDAESELSNILTHEILAEINREVVRSIYITAKVGAQNNTKQPGFFNMDLDSGGRWMVERFKGLIYQIERDANAIGHETRRGRGNFILVSADVASALTLSGVLDYAPAMSTSLNVDDTSTTYAGVLNGRFKVYIDPFSANISDVHFYCVGYKGPTAYDAGLFYCPYVPLQMLKAQDPNSFQPKMGFKTRYGIVANPFVELDDSAGGGNPRPLTADSLLSPDKNYYYRITTVQNLM